MSKVTLVYCCLDVFSQQFTVRPHDAAIYRDNVTPRKSPRAWTEP